AVLPIVYGALNGINASQSLDPRTAEALEQLTALIKTELLPGIARQLARASYRTNFAKFKNFYEARDALRVKLDVALSKPWRECVTDVGDWSASAEEIWQDSLFPESVRRFVDLIRQYQRSFLRQTRTKGDLRKMVEQ